MEEADWMLRRKMAVVLSLFVLVALVIAGCNFPSAQRGIDLPPDKQLVLKDIYLTGIGTWVHYMVEPFLRDRLLAYRPMPSGVYLEEQIPFTRFRADVLAKWDNRNSTHYRLGHQAG
jgi:hypothetical protein